MQTSLLTEDHAKVIEEQVSTLLCGLKSFISVKEWVLFCFLKKECACLLMIVWQQHLWTHEGYLAARFHQRPVFVVLLAVETTFVMLVKKISWILWCLMVAPSFRCILKSIFRDYKGFVLKIKASKVLATKQKPNEPYPLLQLMFKYGIFSPLKYSL